MRRILLGSVITAAFVVVAACVGEDPEVQTGSPVDGGGADGGSSSGSDPPDSSTTGDGGSTEPGDDSGAAVDAGYDVRALPALRLWLESSMGLVGDPGFVSWSDSSGRYDAGVMVAVPQEVNPPTVVPNGINGRPVLRFIDGNGWIKIENHPDLHFGTGDFAIVVVAKVTGGDGYLWELWPMSLPKLRGTALSPKDLCLTFARRGGDRCTSNPTIPSPEPHVFVGRRNGAQISFRVDGVVRGTYDLVESVDTTEHFEPAFLGRGLNLELAEVIVLVGPTPDARLVGLEQHLKAKYIP